MENDSKNTRDFYRVATWSTCFGFAVLGALLGSFRETATNYEWFFSIRTVLGVVIGIVAGWLIWKIFRSLAERKK
jgi:hypothetical protein